MCVIVFQANVKQIYRHSFPFYKEIPGCFTPANTDIISTNETDIPLVLLLSSVQASS